MRRKQLTPLLFIVLAAIGALVAVVASSTTPQLGLDLQGGVSVVLQPTEEVDGDRLDQTIEIIRNRVDALGVAEPEIARQGDAVVVQLPGVENQQRALELVGDTAELRFRPVLNVLPGSIEDALSSTTTTTAPTATTAPADGSTTVPAPVEGQSAAGAATPFQEDPAATTTVPPVDPSATTTTVPLTTGFELTPREDDLPDQPVVLAERDDQDEIVATYQLGPTAATGEIVADAAAELGGTGQWSVRLEIKGGAAIESFNAIAAQCNSAAQTCPSGQLAIVLDSDVVSAPQISQPSYERDQIQISGSFGEREAKDLALVLRYGSLPVNLEPQTVQTVSATLGEDSLRAGLAAGLVGLALVCLYILVYYRALGLVVVLGLGVWSALNYSIISWLGETQGLALSLAGVTGLVVSVGVTVDSYVVYFERLKDEVAAGRTLRSSTERAFKRSWRTILAANLSSLIGAALLYWLTVGPVRGFAFFLGLATLLDIVVAWFFIRPMVALLAANRFFTESPRFGVARGLAGRTGAMDASAAAVERRRSVWTRLYHGETHVRFVPRLRRWGLVSLLVIAVGMVSLVTRGLNLGIDFEGGVVWEVPAGDLSVADAQELVEGEGLEDVTVQTLEADGEEELRIEAAATDPDLATDITRLLAEETGTDVDEVSFTSVGPSWGDEISEKALRALIFFLIAITIYISFRFELRMAIPTLVALLHDIAVTIGVYSLFGFEVTPATVIALLTILGFSIYDGIVVFDKVDENTPLVGSKEDLTYGEMVDQSLNEVLMRSLNTSITALLPVASLLVLGSFVLGATTLEEFALALLVGLFAGAYSSIFIASPLLAILKEREPRFRDVKARVASRREATGRVAAPPPAAPVVPVADTGADAAAEPGGRPPSTTAVAERPAPTPTSSGDRIIPPRPRKKGRKR
jgi:protein-export membrane protein SecD/preprotein translocase SecF subunit